MGFSGPGRQVKILRENYLEPKFSAIEEKIEYLITTVEYLVTVVESGISQDELDSIKKKIEKKSKEKSESD